MTPESRAGSPEEEIFRDALHRTADALPPLPDLVPDAVREGERRRVRSQGLAVAGTFVAVTAVTLGLALLGPLLRQTPDTEPAAPAPGPSITRPTPAPSPDPDGARNRHADTRHPAHADTDRPSLVPAPGRSLAHLARRASGHARPGPVRHRAVRSVAASQGRPHDGPSWPRHAAAQRTGPRRRDVPAARPPRGPPRGIRRSGPRTARPRPVP
ncbi:hypothetical protein SCYAM73S_07134 [Streptomyces cyaneofuscatus]